MLLAVGPETSIHSSIRPDKYAKAVLAVVLVLAAILTAVLPDVLADAVHRRVFPSAFEATPIAADVHSLSADCVGLPAASELGAVRPEVDAIAHLSAADETSLVPRAVAAGLNAIALLLIVVPRALVHGGARLPQVHADAMRHIASPFPHVGVAVAMREASFPLSLVLPPFALVARAVHPRLDAKSMSSRAPPLSCIDRAAPKSVRWSSSHFGRALHLLDLTQLRDFPVEVSGWSGISVLAQAEVLALHRVRIVQTVGLD
mmetsp:Transcript_19430/g.42452  ORF Transcript_19430/g.42452 Transcript_19430/m.42452 type:complete len:260 (-) Transcript_19430:188-967(-)